jgi:hypothetical protein
MKLYQESISDTNQLQTLPKQSREGNTFINEKLSFPEGEVRTRISLVMEIYGPYLPLKPIKKA